MNYGIVMCVSFVKLNMLEGLQTAPNFPLRNSYVCFVDPYSANFQQNVEVDTVIR